MFVCELLRYGQIDPLDRAILLAQTLKQDRSWILAHPEYNVSTRDCARFKKLVARREKHEPLAYITGTKEFFGLSFYVNRSTLIPRPETEILVESALEYLQKQISTDKNKRRVIVDVGTGSGNIIISLAKHIPVPLSFFAVDTSKRALNVAIKNAKHHRVLSKITFVQSDLLKRIQEELCYFDELIVLANLPYLSHSLYQRTAPTVQTYEPKTALLSGQDGLDHYQRLFAQLKSLAAPQKIVFWLEISPEQEESAQLLCRSAGAAIQKIIPDLAGKTRVVQGTFPAH